MNKNNERDLFYTRCGEILNIEHNYHTPVRRTRWTNRNLGNGRYPGFGLIQCFGSCIRVVTRKETVLFYDYDAVYEYLETNFNLNTAK